MLSVCNISFFGKNISQMRVVFVTHSKNRIIHDRQLINIRKHSMNNSYIMIRENTDISMAISKAIISTKSKKYSHA